MHKHLLKITKYSHFFKCTEISDNVKTAIYNFAKVHLVKEDVMRDARGMEISRTATVYGAANADRSEFRFHINIYTLFLEHLARLNYRLSEFLVEEKAAPEGDDIDIRLQDHWNLRGDQVPIVEYLTKKDGPIARFVGIQPGGGKTLCSTAAMIAYGKRMIAIVKPMYIDKWESDIVKISNTLPSEILKVRGGPELKKFLRLCDTPGGLDGYKAIIISNSTMRVWLTVYERFGEESEIMGYHCMPDELYEKAGVGVRLIDEVHQDFHLNYKLDLYTNVAKSISLSATLISDEPFMDKVYRMAYPMANRYNGGALKKYTAAFGVTYSIDNSHKIRTTEFNQSSYSHNAFEKSILKNPELFARYAQMIKVYLDLGYISTYQKGRKAIVFASSKDMCGRLTQYFQKVYPHLDIRRYVDEDPYANLNEPDIRFTTVLSAGTAHDVPGLTAAFLTIAMQSIKANVQVFGRLREIPDYTPRFYFFSCLDVPKHMKYHKDKVEIMRERAVSFASVPYNRTL